jgi:hypothetical protein
VGGYARLYGRLVRDPPGWARAEQLRLFRPLENGTEDEPAKRGLAGSAIAVITGMRKLWKAGRAETWSGRGRLRQCFAVVRGFAVGPVVG